MARRKRRKSSRKLRPGQCKTINTPGGRRKLCNVGGRVKFVKMSSRKYR